MTFNWIMQIANILLQYLEKKVVERCSCVSWKDDTYGANLLMETSGGQQSH